jgi:hypothetical protein
MIECCTILLFWTEWMLGFIYKYIFPFLLLHYFIAVLHLGFGKKMIFLPECLLYLTCSFLTISFSYDVFVIEGTHPEA